MRCRQGQATRRKRFKFVTLNIYCYTLKNIRECQRGNTSKAVVALELTGSHCWLQQFRTLLRHSRFLCKHMSAEPLEDSTHTPWAGCATLNLDLLVFHFVKIAPWECGSFLIHGAPDMLDDLSRQLEGCDFMLAVVKFSKMNLVVLVMKVILVNTHALCC